MVNDLNEENCQTPQVMQHYDMVLQLIVITIIIIINGDDDNNGNDYNYTDDNDSFAGNA